MVIVTRSAYKRGSESFNSDVSEKNIIPPWCSSGKAYEWRARRNVAPWESKSFYPVRENIREYLKGNKIKRVANADIIKGINKQTLIKQPRRRNCLKLIFFLLVIATGIIYFVPHIPRMVLVRIFSKPKSISLMNMVKWPVRDDCCYEMKYLAYTLSNTEEALRKALRLRNTMLTSQYKPTHIDPIKKGMYIDGATAYKGSDTTEWGGRVVLWGMVPLWKAVTPPDIVLALRQPTPTDCWPFSGSRGEIIIKVPQRLRVDQISVEHVRPDIARSAPKHFIVFGILNNGTWMKLIDGIYIHNRPAKQYYLINKNILLEQIAFRILSNQGNPNYTCIYRVHLYT